MFAPCRKFEYTVVPAQYKQPEEWFCSYKYGKDQVGIVLYPLLTKSYKYIGVNWIRP